MTAPTQGADARALRRCIFCGRDRLRVEETGRHAWVVCVDCDAEGPALNTAEVAVAAWNRIAAALERVEALTADAECWRLLKRLAEQNPYVGIAHGDGSEEAALAAWEVEVITGKAWGAVIEEATTAEDALRVAAARAEGVNSTPAPAGAKVGEE